jgi:ABC-type amino acid transport substrate-binding protein
MSFLRFVAGMGRLASGVGLGLVLVLGGGLCQAASVVRFAPEKDYGPFVFEGTDGRVQGLSVDMLDALKPALKLSITTLPAQPLAGILAATQRGEVDLISSLRPTPERAAYLAFTAPYVQVPAVLVVRQATRSKGLQELKGLPVAVGQGYAVEAFVRRAHPQVDWQAVPDDLTALQGLLAGRYQGVVADIASVSHAVRTQQIKGVQVAQTIGFEYPLSFAYRKELTELGQQLDAALLQLDPLTRRQITDRWIDAETLKFEDPKRSMLRWTGVVLAVLAAVVLGWSYLKRWLARAAS